MRFSHNCRKHFGKHWVCKALFGNDLKLAVGQPNESYKKAQLSAKWGLNQKPYDSSCNVLITH